MAVQLIFEAFYPFSYILGLGCRFRRVSFDVTSASWYLQCVSRGLLALLILFHLLNQLSPAPFHLAHQLDLRMPPWGWFPHRLGCFRNR